MEQRTMNFFEDVTAKRHDGSETSVAANRVAEHGKGFWRARIVAYASEPGRNFTLKEICEAFGRPLNALSGRISELKRDRVLRQTGERRNGCAVLELRPVFREV